MNRLLILPPGACGRLLFRGKPHNCARHLSTSSTARLATSASTKPQQGGKKVSSELREGMEVEGFVVQQVAAVPEFHLQAIRLTHAATGAQHLHVERADANNAFSVGFRTTPFDSTGLPHILEHTVLCGSERYPVRDPFFKMLNRSMATFMNAMTGPDYTMYPFATQNPRDYRNLMSVYLDAVFRPHLRRVDFAQEGWRLEHSVLSDRTSPLTLRGVVFNEMKGAFAENQAVFGQRLLNSLLPSHTYGHVSGGDPLAIPRLNHADLVEFHRHHYRPGNGRIYSYGNIPLRDTLGYVNSEYLLDGRWSGPDPDTSVPREPGWDSPRRLHVQCRPDPMAADPERQSTLAISMVMGDVTEVQQTLELQVLSELLTRGPGSPLHRALVEPRIGAGFAPCTGYDAHTRDTIFSVGLHGLPAADFARVEEVFNRAIEDTANKGFEPEHIQAVLHGIELHMRHQSADFGLGLLFGLTPIWNHDGDVVKALRVADQVSVLRGKLKDNPHHFQDLLKCHILKNKHRLILSMSPDPEFEAKQMEDEQKLLQSKISALKTEEREEVYRQGLELASDQGKQEDTSCLPSLAVADLGKDCERTTLGGKTTDGVPVQICVQPTNGVTYIRGVLDVRDLDEAGKDLLPVLCDLLGRMGTRSMNYRELDKQARLYTGGLHFNTHVADHPGNRKDYEQGLLVSTHFLDANAGPAFDLLAKLFAEVTLDDVARFDELVQAAAADLATGIADSGHHYAIAAAASLVSPSAALKERLVGLSHVGQVVALARQQDRSSTLDRLRGLASSVLNGKRLRCAVNLSPQEESAVLSHVDRFLGSLHKVDVGGQTIVPAPKVPSTSLGIHHVHSMPVNFNAKSVLTVHYLHPHYAALRILSRLLTSRYLFPQVREKGGAYGAGASLGPSGVLSFYSYRDPNSTRTLEVFDGAKDWTLGASTFSERDIEEAKLGVFQSVDAPIPPGSRGMGFFLYGISDDILQSHREALKGVTRAALEEVAAKYLTEGAQCGRAVVGPGDKGLCDRKGEKWEVRGQQKA